MRTRIKICGITRGEDAQAAVSAGADALGFVFYRPSPRFVSPSQAAAIVAALPVFVGVVGLFVDATEADVEAVLAQVPVTVLQFHGQETEAFCASFGRPYMKAVRMAPGVDLEEMARRYRSAAALLLDGYDPARPGGTGSTFDWARVPDDLDCPVVLAGGLTADNVGHAIAEVHPYAVDVSGGVERAPGIKDAARMTLFCRRVWEEQ